MARENDIHAFGTTTITLAATGTLLIPEEAGQVSGTVKYLSGGSLEIVGVGVGITYTGTSLSSLPGKGYFLDISETINFEGPVRYYLVATGSPAVLSVLKGLSSGY